MFRSRDKKKEEEMIPEQALLQYAEAL